jgi:hypothetical protein
LVHGPASFFVDLAIETVEEPHVDTLVAIREVH